MYFLLNYSVLLNANVFGLSLFLKEGHPPGKKLVGGNGRPAGTTLLIKSKTVLAVSSSRSHELNAKQQQHDNDEMPGVQQQQQQRTSPAPPSSPLRSKVKTNGHLIPYMQQVGLIPLSSSNQSHDISKLVHYSLMPS